VSSIHLVRLLHLPQNFLNLKEKNFEEICFKENRLVFGLKKQFCDRRKELRFRYLVPDTDGETHKNNRKHGLDSMFLFGKGTAILGFTYHKDRKFTRLLVDTVERQTR